MKRTPPTSRIAVANAVAFLLLACGLCFADVATFTAYDDAYAVDGTSESATGDYIVAGYDAAYSAPYCIGAFRFSSVLVPQGATVTSAYIRVQAYLDGTGASTLAIKGEDVDAATELASLPYIGSRAQTTASVTWPVKAAMLEDQVYTSPDITSVVQEIVDRGGWSEGNPMVIFMNNTVAVGGYQYIYSCEGAPKWGATAAQLIIGIDGTFPDPPADGIKSENYIPGGKDTPSSVPTYLNSPSMYYPPASGGLCWATTCADIFAYWDRNPYSNGVTYWNLIDHGTAPLLQPSQPSGPGHDQADVKAVVAYMAEQYYDPNNRTSEEAEIIEEVANDQNGLSFNATYHSSVLSTAGKSGYLAIVKGEIDAGRPIGLGSWGTYFGGGHQVPCLGYQEYSNVVNSTVYIHRNTGGTQSEYVNFFTASWAQLDMDTIVPGGTPVDDYEGLSDDTAAGTTATIVPAGTFDFRQTHNTDSPGEADWTKLVAVSGQCFTVETKALASGADPKLYLYDTDRVTELARDDDSGQTNGAARFTWHCKKNGTYYIKAQHSSAAASGHTTKYDLEIAAETDLGANGTPGWWLDMNGIGGNRTAGELTNTDGDGLLAWQEWWAGTSPTNNLSVLCVVDFQEETNNRLPLATATQPGKRYRLQGSQSLSPVAWSNITYSLTATGPTTSGAFQGGEAGSTTNYVPVDAGSQFFRVILEQ